MSAWSKALDLITRGRWGATARLMRVLRSTHPGVVDRIEDGVAAALEIEARLRGVEVAGGFDPDLGFWATAEGPGGRYRVARAASVVDALVEVIARALDTSRAGGVR